MHTYTNADDDDRDHAGDDVGGDDDGDVYDSDDVGGVMMAMVVVMVISVRLLFSKL